MYNDHPPLLPVSEAVPYFVVELVAGLQVVEVLLEVLAKELFIPSQPCNRMIEL